MGRSTIAVAAMLIGGALATPASAECTCRGPGVTAKHGETVCLQTPAGLRLARCEMVLNNASWTFLPDACPEASLEKPGGFANRMSPLPKLQVALR
jgi:hypothetical protein